VIIWTSSRIGLRPESPAGEPMSPPLPTKCCFRPTGTCSYLLAATAPSQAGQPGVRCDPPALSDADRHSTHVYPGALVAMVAGPATAGVTSTMMCLVNGCLQHRRPGAVVASFGAGESAPARWHRLTRRRLPTGSGPAGSINPPDRRWRSRQHLFELVTPRHNAGSGSSRSGTTSRLRSRISASQMTTRPRTRCMIVPFG
jgi:hypothetical protein